MRTLWVVFAVYLGLVLLIGELAARRRVRSADDFLVAGRRQGRLATAGTLTATVLGGGSTLGAAGVAYYVGLSASWYLLSASVGLVLLGWTLGPALRRLGVYTVPEFVERRYGAPAGALASGLGLLGLVLFLAAQLFALGALAAELAGANQTAAIAIAGAAVVAYTWRGGIFAVHWSDNLQLAWIAAGIGLAAVVGVRAAGGLAALEAPPPAAGFEELGRSWFHPLTREPNAAADLLALGDTALAWVIMSVTWHFAMQSTAQRLVAARDPATARWACLAAAAALLPLAALVALAGMAARVLHPELAPGRGIEQAAALPALLAGSLDPLLGGVVLAALAAVIMSTADSALLGAATIAVRDVAPRLRPGAGGSPSLRGVRAATALLGLCAAGAALLTPTLVRMLELVAAIYCVALFVPLLAGLYWRRANGPGAVAAMLLGGLGGALWRILGAEAASGVHMLNVALPLALAGMAIGSLAGGGPGRGGEPVRPGRPPRPTR